jgi:DNA-binding response OmpR family regulator
MARVMIVDDEPQISGLARYHLELEGFDADEFQEAEVAWRTLLSQPYDAAVVDITLHGRLDGWGLIKRLRGDSRFRGMPVVVMTGLDDPEVPTRAAELGCSYLSKDSIPEIVDRLRDAIRASMRALRVMLLLPGYSVEGTLHLPLEPQRFSDAWEALIRTPSSFVTLAEPVISTADGEKEATSGPVLEVRKNRILAALPLEDSDEEAD